MNAIYAHELAEGDIIAHRSGNLTVSATKVNVNGTIAVYGHTTRKADDVLLFRGLDPQAVFTVERAA